MNEHYWLPGRHKTTIHHFLFDLIKDECEIYNYNHPAQYHPSLRKLQIKRYF
jgi:hypothetical protein